MTRRSATTARVRRTLGVVAVSIAALVALPGTASAAGGTIHYPASACGSGYSLVQIDTTPASQPAGTAGDATLQRYYNANAASGYKNCALLVARGENYGRNVWYTNGQRWSQTLSVQVGSGTPDSGNFKYYAGPRYGCSAARGTYLAGNGAWGWTDDYYLPSRC